jgi:hypothetical protein
LLVMQRHRSLVAVLWGHAVFNFNSLLLRQLWAVEYVIQNPNPGQPAVTRQHLDSEAGPSRITRRGCGLLASESRAMWR